MTKAILVFAGAFAFCSALGTTGSGCSDEGGVCPTGPDLPLARQPMSITSVSVDSDASTAVNPRGGTLEVTGATVVLRYEHEGLQHEVVYKVHPHPYSPY